MKFMSFKKILRNKPYAVVMLIFPKFGHDLHANLRSHMYISEEPAGKFFCTQTTVIFC